MTAAVVAEMDSVSVDAGRVLDAVEAMAVLRCSLIIGRDLAGIELLSGSRGQVA